MTNNIVLITSVINVSNNPLSETDVRSSFHNKRRLHDTLRTIYSIKELLPDSKIILIECSEMKIQQENFLSEKVDYFVNFFDNKEILEKVDSYSKSLGETIMTVKAIEYIKNSGIEYDNLIKISARYWFNRDFNRGIFDETNLSVFCSQNGSDDNDVISSIYKLSKEDVDEWKKYLCETEERYKNETKFQVVLTNFVKERIQDTRRVIIKGRIGINGFSSSNGNYLNS